MSQATYPGAMTDLRVAFFGSPDFAVPTTFEGTRMPLSRCRTVSFIGAASFVMIGRPNASAS